MGIGGGIPSYSRKPKVTQYLLHELHRLKDAKRHWESFNCPLVRCSGERLSGYLRDTVEQLRQNNHQSPPIEEHHSDPWCSQSSWSSKVSLVAPSIGFGRGRNSNLVGHQDLMIRTVSPRYPRANRRCSKGSRSEVTPTETPSQAGSTKDLMI